MTGPDPARSLVLTRLPGRATAPDAAQVMRLFPARPAVSGWPATRQSREQVLNRLLAPPFTLDNPAGQAQRRRGLTRMLDWLGSQPGQTWQERWIVSGAEDSSPWRQLPDRWLAGAGLTRVGTRPGYGLGAGLLLLICGDVIRPGMPWLLASSGLQSMAAAMGRVRDPDAFARLRRLCETEQASPVTRDLSLRRIAIIMAAKGGRVGDITAGDCVELCRLADDIGGSRSRGMYFYQLLRGTGVFPAGAPATSRMFITQGQLSPGQMLSRYAIACRPVHDLIVDYLREQQLAVDHATLRSMAHVLGKLFWRDLERHHPGIGSLRLAPEVAAGWKQRILVKTSRSVTAAGDAVETSAPRTAAAGALFTVRAFYLDIAQWAADDPARWAQWAAPCPIRDGEVPHAKELARRKARMDQRTRERLPALPVLAAAVGEERAASAARLAAGSAAGPGEDFTAGGQTLCRSVMSSKGSARVWADDPGTGKRRDLTLEEHRGFWAWAAVEVLRHSGIRIEELTELSHHSLVQYRLPATGELIPLLQIAPSKTDTERLLVISPELADVLSIIISRIRGTGDSVPLVVAYDDNERQWNPPMPLLFQRRLRAENSPVTAQAIRQLLDIALARTALTDAAGQPLRFAPHDFRRMLITDAIMHGMPPHIAQLVAGHRDINTTMGYKAVYPEEVINGHRAFIARRRALRPSQEYRTPTDAEWDEFLGHFERRRVALGDCGRAYYGSSHSGRDLWRNVGNLDLLRQPPRDHACVTTTQSRAAAAVRIGAGLGRRKRAELLGLLRPCFTRVEPCLQAGKYVAALMSQMPRRNGWTIAEHAGDRAPDKTQRLLNRAVWDAAAAAGVVRRFAVAGLDQAGGRRGLVVGAVDETGQVKQGGHTAGVKRHYLGCAGKVANGITTVHVAYVREKAGHALVAARQWIPREHIDDPAKQQIMGLPDDLVFRTKGQLAIDLLAEVFADGIWLDFVCGDEVYGACTRLREYLEGRGQGYVLRVPSNFHLTMARGVRLSCKQAATRLLASGRSWETRSAGKGSKGARWYAWAWLATISPRHYLLIRRHLITGELAFHYCYVPQGRPLSLSRLARAAGLRWPVEESFEFSKGCFGLDQSQVRLYTAIARHTVLVMAALAICAVTAALLRRRTGTQAPPPVRPGQPPPADPGMVPLTVPETARLLASPPPPRSAGHWLNWRRRHQALSAWHHQRTRLTRDTEITQVS